MTAQSCKSHHDLILWRKAVDLAVEAYRVSAAFPRSEIYGLTAQLRRAAVSVPSSIAEGCARRTTRDFISFLHVARGSLAEVETQLLIAQRVNAVQPDGCCALQDLIDETGKMLHSLINRLRNRVAAASSC
jgi:four helix bundle protein